MHRCVFAIILYERTNMTIHYLLDIAAYSRCKKETVSGAESVYELLKMLCEKYGDAFCKMVFNDDMSDIGSDVVILVNGINAALSDGLNMPLKDEDTVAIFPEIMGG